MIRALIVFFISITCMAQGFNPNKDLYKLRNLKKSQKIFQGLKNLHKETIKRKKILQSSKSYNGTEFHYILTLEKLLSLLPKTYLNLPNCENLYSQIMAGDKSPWEKQSKPTHKVWMVFEKICKKSSE